MVSSLVPGMPAVPKPWLSTGASTGFSCQVNPNRFKAVRMRERTQQKEKKRNVSVKTGLRTKHLPQGCQTPVLEACSTAEFSFLSTSFSTLDSTHELIPTASMVGICCVISQVQISEGFKPSRMSSICLVGINGCGGHLKGWKV